MAYRRKRRKMRKRVSKRVFQSGAKVRGKNFRARPMRGGWRL